jgi:hypothetical protein
MKRAASLEPKLAAVIQPVLDRAADEAPRKFTKFAAPLGDSGFVAPAMDELLDVMALADRLERKLTPVTRAVVQTILDASVPHRSRLHGHLAAYRLGCP